MRHELSKHEGVMTPALRGATKREINRGPNWTRPKRPCPEGMNELYARWKLGKISYSEIAEMYEVSISTVKRWFLEVVERERQSNMG